MCAGELEQRVSGDGERSARLPQIPRGHKSRKLRGRVATAKFRPAAVGSVLPVGFYPLNARPSLSASRFCDRKSPQLVNESFPRLSSGPAASAQGRNGVAPRHEWKPRWKILLLDQLRSFATVRWPCNISGLL